MYNQCLWFPDFTPFCSMTSPFWDAGYFETSAPNDPKVTLNQARSNYPLCMTSVRDSQISLRFALRPALFKIQAILRQVHQMTPNWPWALQRQITLYLYNNCPRVSNFTPFRSMASHFGVTGHAPNDLKMTLNTTRSKVLHICVTSVPESKILVRFVLQPVFSMI